MTDLQRRKDKLLKFVVETLKSRIDLHRGFEHYSDTISDDFKYRNQEEFFAGQKSAINNLKDPELATYELIQKKIIPKARVMDEESWVAFEMAGFFFTKDKTPVFFNSR